MTIFKLPDLGEGLLEAEIIEWYVKEGDSVDVDQPLVSMETAKAVVDLPSPQKGKIKKRFGQEGDVIKTSAPLIEFEGNEKSATEHFEVGSGTTAVGEIEIGNQTIAADTVVEQTDNKTVVKAMPAARILAKQFNIDINTIKPSGPNQIITVTDVENSSQHLSSIHMKGKVESLHGVRREMALAMVKAHAEVVPVIIYDDADIHHFKKEEDIMVRVIRAIVAACKKEPQLNAYFNAHRMESILFDEINLAIAIDSDRGLFVPVIQDVAKLDDKSLRQRIDLLKQKVKDRTIKLEEMQGATFTLTNYGVFAGRYATPVIIPPTVAILGVGKIREEVVAIKGKPAIHRVIPLSLNMDHRAVTGGEATRFLAAVIESLGMA